MRKQFIADAAAIALAITLTTGSTAFANGSGGGGGDGEFGDFHGGAVRGSYAAMHVGRHVAGGYGRHRYAGPGVGVVDYSGYCSPYYGDDGYCGTSYTIGW